MPPLKKPAASAKAGTGGASGEVGRGTLGRPPKAAKVDFDAMLERRVIKVLRAIQPVALLHRPGPRARDRRRPDPRIRALGEQEIREVARQAPAHRLRSSSPRATSCLPISPTARPTSRVGNIKVLDELLKSIDFVAPRTKVPPQHGVAGDRSRRRAMRRSDEAVGKSGTCANYSSFSLS